MEKVNVYDWDKTIFPVDSTVAFVRWCLRRHPGVIRALLGTLLLLPGYRLGKVRKTAIKERMYGVLRRAPDVDAELEAFWAQNFARVNPWYLAQRRPDDIIISASPEFLVRIPVAKLRQIDALRERGIRTCVLSNNNPASMKYIRRMFTADGKTMDDYFDAVFLSYELHELKPSEAIFRKMIAAGGMRPEETLFIDDGQ